VLIEGGLPAPTAYRNYELTPDDRVLATVSRGETTGEERRIRLVMNWFAELRASVE
jgi:hypothetical protein